ncbi:hypothetical protein CRYUN_Cryun11dG0026400 [Craigia yunnanensis]
MASQVSQILSSPHKVISSNMENRPKANFHPGIWGDLFLNCPNKSFNKKKLSSLCGILMLQLNYNMKN